MKKLLLLLLLVTGAASAQIVNIPDPAFKAELIADGVDTNMDGEIQVTEAMATIAIDLETLEITDLTGIEAFVNLETFQSIHISPTVVDLTSNINLTQVEIVDSAISPIASIDISSCTALEELIISGTSITSLDCTTNVNLTALYIAGNSLLETVFIKNGSDESSNMGPGSWLENWLFGNNPSLLYVCADEFQVQEIQGFAGTNYNVNSYCNFPPGGDYNTITGVSRFDEENDGCDLTDLAIPYQKYNVDLNGGANSTVYADSLGVYNLYVAETGTYNITPDLENPSYFSITPSPASVVVPAIDNSIVQQDFCITANGVNPDLEVVFAPLVPASPGFQAFYLLSYKNKGNQAMDGDVTFNFDDNVIDFIGASAQPDIEAFGELTFNFTDLEPLQTVNIYMYLYINSPTDTPPVNIDDVLEFTATINPIAGDEFPNDNIFDFDQIVVGSYDPNNIICIEGESVATTYIGEYLHYIINFENTGNAPAQNIVVTMEVDPEDFDQESLRVLTASDDMYVNVVGNLVEFNFPEIFLDTGGHGNILLKMKTKETLTTADEVALQANIYFDYNFPVLTNEAVTSFRILGVDGFDVSHISVFPNPTNNIVNIQSLSTIKNIEVYDVQGRKIQAVEATQQNTQVDISALRTGVYFFSIKTEKGSTVKKIVKR
ncbi:T9SS type A sorting domain-containing protein [Marinirhabdus gelatinilytica]|uniref:Putative repeat protein (TIGR01451 family)/predicted secreted protein (Por secretion system target) n=1 Tax=Marinirhabdus gelatinilytica TaxID=1703343 RepID=A0A370QJZ5_9FLAO|nr:T9SS type A sorting domain-containing protein [Marinirhabdus gelatinilytica]RDK88672.1 putative repeat protein (TIGR01451 family)/predicted secreted protein (Por secretion system target) [Marinirhabdus gelatinilytica]